MSTEERMRLYLDYMAMQSSGSLLDPRKDMLTEPSASESPPEPFSRENVDKRSESSAANVIPTKEKSPSRFHLSASPIPGLRASLLKDDKNGDSQQELHKEKKRNSGNLFGPETYRLDIDDSSLGQFRGVPPGSLHFLAPDGTKFAAPSRTDFKKIYEAGVKEGLAGINEAITQWGKFDFQRNMGKGRSPDGNIYYRAYADASNYAVGVYMRGAGISLFMTRAIAEGYAKAKSSNAGDPKQVQMWINGWKAADSGNPNGK